MRKKLTQERDRDRCTVLTKDMPIDDLLSPVDVATSSRVWLTCEDPEQLLKKYTEYAHGDSKGDKGRAFTGCI